MNNEGKIVSPYVDVLGVSSRTESEFLGEIKQVCDKHGYKNFFIAFERKHITNDSMSAWAGSSNSFTKDMVAFLSIISRIMRKKWEEEKQ